MEKKFLVLLSWVYLSSFVFGLPRSNILKSEEEEYGNFFHTPGFKGIVGGAPTRAGKYPFMVALYEEDSDFYFICGGSVLNENWIITAAHCIDYVNEPSRYLAVVGSHRIDGKEASNAQTIKISEIFLHEDYDTKTSANDIALLKTAKAINIFGSKGYVDRIRLPITDKDPTGSAKVIGWGLTSQGGEDSDILKEVVVPIVQRDHCNDVYKGDITEKNICAGRYNADSCQGDSGGPLFQTSPSGVSTLIGIVSHGRGCGKRDFPGVYTKVSSYKKWIKEIMS